MAGMITDWVAVDGGRGLAWRMVGGARQDDLPLTLDRGDLSRIWEHWPEVADVVVADAQAFGLSGNSAADQGVPCPVLPAFVQVAQGGRRIWTMRPVTQTRPRDRMGADAARIAGVLAQAPGFDGVICLAGARGRWALISADEICHFQSFITGRLCALLSSSTGEAGPNAPLLDGGEVADNLPAFYDALDLALSRPHRAWAGLDALTPPKGGEDQARLWGVMLGLELGAARPYWLGQPVIVAGQGDVAGLYHKALTAQGVEARIMDGDAAFYTGLYQGLCAGVARQ